ncbi:uncharacterized protein [Typha angustifolia]|uniref:uncharacterized protein n=1 Tax=Typha angustifolia TaxID=59011 RepID=UPI003C2FC4CC
MGWNYSYVAQKRIPEVSGVFGPSSSPNAGYVVVSSFLRRPWKISSININLTPASRGKFAYIWSLVQEKVKEQRMLVRGTNKLPVKNIIKQIGPMTGTWRMMTVSTPQKHEKDKVEELGRIMNENVEPLIAFSKPPLPPVLGPLLIFSLLEMSTDGDGN